MAKIDIITLSALTASDGSIIANGATVKFQTIFNIGSISVKVYPKIWRNRELFESGFTDIQVSNEVLPDDITLSAWTEEEFYNLTPLALYQEVTKYLNGLYDTDYFEIQIIT